MTLATRCTACGTTFKVVQDQLKVSAGWVRCGRCSEVFNAIEGLFEIGPAAVEPYDASAADAPQLPVDETFAIDFSASNQAHKTAGEAVDATLAPAASEPVAAAAAADDDRRVVVAQAAPSPPDQTHESSLEADVAPGFVRQAERAARWQRPGVRRSLAASAWLLVFALVAQVTVEYRNTVAAQWPATRAALTEGCAWIGCRIEPMRRISALSVESSGLDQLGSTTIYKLSAVLRNRSQLDLMLPALDLVLSDAQGSVIARRVLTAAELGSPSRTLAARGELSLQASLNAGDRRVAGYTIEIFYP